MTTGPDLQAGVRDLADGLVPSFTAHRGITDTLIELSTDQAAITGYGPLEPIARNTVNLTKIAT
jgi:hypothetical protein